MLNFDVGSSFPLENESAIRTERGKVGHAVFGPYEWVEPGRYVVEFLIKDSDGGPRRMDEILAVVDVVSHSGYRTHAFDYVSWAQIQHGDAVWLEFDLQEPAELEYRVHVNGGRSLIIQDHPKVSKRPGDAPARTRVPGLDAVESANKMFFKHLFERGVAVDFDGQSMRIPQNHFDEFRKRLIAYEENRSDLALSVVHAVGYRGDDENSLYRAFVGTAKAANSPPRPVPFTSTICQQSHFAYDQYRFWANALKETPRYQRKQWEFVYIAQSLFERGMLEPGRRGLVFGAGQEQLPSLFASFGVKVLATDQAPDLAVKGGWIESGQHTYDIAALNQRNICTERMFQELVSYRSVDMNDIPADMENQFDFCWSACAFEHLGSLDSGLRFVENSLRTLRPGGIAVHTTEYNLGSNDDTIETENLSIYRRKDIEAFVEKMNNEGFEVAPIDWEPGEGFAETVVDLPPFGGRGEPHIRLRVGDYDTTSLGLIIRKPSDVLT